MLSDRCRLPPAGAAVPHNEPMEDTRDASTLDGLMLLLGLVLFLTADFSGGQN